MTVFWIVAACLVAAGLLFIIPPLFSRQQATEVQRAALNVSIYKNQLQELEVDRANGDLTEEYYTRAREEIERRLLEDTAVADSEAKAPAKALNVSTAVIVTLAVPVFAVGLYNYLGTPAAVNPAYVEQAVAQSPHGGNEAEMAMQIEQMVQGLYERLQADPSDIEGWVMLGRSFSVLGRYDEAVLAYERATQFVGDEPNVLADYADALAMATGGSLEGKPMAMLDRALVSDPNHQKALWLMATALFERGDFTGSLSYWEHLMTLYPQGSDERGQIMGAIQEARKYKERQDAGEFGAVPPPKMYGEGVTISENTAPAAGRTISGLLKLDASLADKVAPTDIVYVFAKAVSGPPMPLAILKTQASELPLTFTLDESMAMMPNMSLARFDEVLVSARISKTGDAIAQSGDLQGDAGAIKVGRADVEIVINSVVP